MDDPRLERLLNEVSRTSVSQIPNLVRRAFVDGGTAERERSARVFRKIREALGELEVPDETPTANQQAVNGRAVLSPPSAYEYGAVINRVRDAVDALVATRPKFTAQDVLNKLNETNPEHGLTMVQIRHALKTMVNQESIRRVDRGLFEKVPEQSERPATHEPTVPSPSTSIN